MSDKFFKDSVNNLRPYKISDFDIWSENRNYLKLDWNECPLFMPRTYSQTVDFVGTFEEKNVTTYAF